MVRTIPYAVSSAVITFGPRVRRSNRRSHHPYANQINGIEDFKPSCMRLIDGSLVGGKGSSWT